MLTSEAINEIATACAKAQLDLKPAVKDALNPAFRSRYADYAAIVEAAKVFARNGVAVFQDLTSTDAAVFVTTRLIHTSGQSIEVGPLLVPLGVKRDAHALGSAATYGKRYSLSAALAISADEDDDANAASDLAVPLAKKVAAPPPGVEDWILDLEAVAAEGTAALKAAWAKSPDASRDYLMTSNMPKWEAIKKLAVDADAKARKKDKVSA